VACHWNDGAPAALDDCGVSDGSQKKVVRTQLLVDVATSRGRWCRINTSEARTASTITNNNQQVKWLWVADNAASDKRGWPSTQREGKGGQGVGGQCRGQCRWSMASGGGSRQQSMVLARWATKEVTGFSIDVWVRQRWLDATRGGGEGRQSQTGVGGGNGNGSGDEMRVREYKPRKSGS
jgi:hypothetical protein